MGSGRVGTWGGVKGGVMWLEEEVRVSGAAAGSMILRYPRSSPPASSSIPPPHSYGSARGRGSYLLMRECWGLGHGSGVFIYGSSSGELWCVSENTAVYFERIRH